MDTYAYMFEQIYTVQTHLFKDLPYFSMFLICTFKFLDLFFQLKCVYQYIHVIHQTTNSTMYRVSISRRASPSATYRAISSLLCEPTGPGLTLNHQSGFLSSHCGFQFCILSLYHSYKLVYLLLRDLFCQAKGIQIDLSFSGHKIFHFIFLQSN